MSGSTCAPTGFRTGCSRPTRGSSRPPARPGATSWPNPVRSPQSGPEIGLISVKSEGRRYNFLYLIRANQLAGADPARIKAPTLLIYSPTDLVFPQSWIERTAAALREAGTPVEMIPLHGPKGHLNGLLHIAQAGSQIS